MNWGHKIVIAFILFAIVIITMVSISMRQDVNLVATNYYEEELVYQDQINRILNYNNLTVKPSLKKTENALTISFPLEIANELKEGTIHFFRPSEGSLDKIHKLKLDNKGVQIFKTTDIKKGLWKSKLKWISKSGKEYYHEETLII